MKSKTIFSDDDPYFYEKLKIMKRRKCREYNKNRRSARWYEMQSKYKIQLDKSKTEFYSRKISKLRRTKPKQWHRELKKLTSFDQHKGEIIVESIKDLTNQEQAEIIAQKFAEISQEYDKLEKDDIDIPIFHESEIPLVTEEQVEEALAAVNKK